MGFDFSIEYKKGIENLAADALSRIHEEAAFQAISCPIPSWLEPIKQSVKEELALQQVVHQIDEGTLSSNWTYKEGIIYFKNRIYLLNPSELIDIIVTEFHKSSHEGYQKTL